MLKSKGMTAPAWFPHLHHHHQNVPSGSGQKNPAILDSSIFLPTQALSIPPSKTLPSPSASLSSQNHLPGPSHDCIPQGALVPTLPAPILLTSIPQSSQRGLSHRSDGVLPFKIWLWDPHTQVLVMLGMFWILPRLRTSAQDMVSLETLPPPLQLAHCLLETSSEKTSGVSSGGGFSLIPLLYPARVSCISTEPRITFPHPIGR